MCYHCQASCQISPAYVGRSSHGALGTADAAEVLLAQLGPGPPARLKGEQPEALAAVTGEEAQVDYDSGPMVRGPHSDRSAARAY